MASLIAASAASFAYSRPALSRVIGYMSHQKKRSFVSILPPRSRSFHSLYANDCTVRNSKYDAITASSQASLMQTLLFRQHSRYSLFSFLCQLERTLLGGAPKGGRSTPSVPSLSLHTGRHAHTHARHLSPSPSLSLSLSQLHVLLIAIQVYADKCTHFRYDALH